MHTLANSEDPDEMWHDAAFHQGLHYLFATSKLSSEKKKRIPIFKVVHIKGLVFCILSKV